MQLLRDRSLKTACHAFGPSSRADLPGDHPYFCKIAKNLDFLAILSHFRLANVACDGNLMPTG
jgi:hypothetical protein